MERLFRSLDIVDRIIYAYNEDGTRPTNPPDINLQSTVYFPLGLTTDGTNLYVIIESASTSVNHRVQVYDTTGSYLRTFQLSNYGSYISAGAIAYDETNGQLWVQLNNSSGTVRFEAFLIPTGSTAVSPVTGEGFTGTAAQRKADAIVWLYGYLVSVDSQDDRFYVYDLSDNSLVSEIDYSVPGGVAGIGKRDDRLYLADPSSNGVDVWDINANFAYTATLSDSINITDSVSRHGPGNPERITVETNEFPNLVIPDAMLDDISTASYDFVSFSVSSQDTNPTGITFSSDGLRMFMIGNSSNSVHQYTLATAWDLSTATTTGVVSFSVSSPRHKSNRNHVLF